jgi:hypothetical protein
MTDRRNAPGWVTGLLVLAGLALLAIAAVYFAEPAKSLPSFFPGHAAGSAHHHTKHGIAAVVVGLAAFAVAWISTGSHSGEASVKQSG